MSYIGIHKTRNKEVKDAPSCYLFRGNNKVFTQHASKHSKHLGSCAFNQSSTHNVCDMDWRCRDRRSAHEFTKMAPGCHLEYKYVEISEFWQWETLNGTRLKDFWNAVYFGMAPIYGFQCICYKTLNSVAVQLAPPLAIICFAK